MDGGRSLHVAIVKGLAVQFETEVNPDRTNRRSVSYTEPRATPNAGKTDVANAITDVAGVEKPDQIDRPGHTSAKLSVEDQGGIPALWESILIDGGIVTQTVEGEPSDPRIRNPPRSAPRLISGTVKESQEQQELVAQRTLAVRLETELSHGPQTNRLKQRHPKRPRLLIHISSVPQMLVSVLLVWQISVETEPERNGPKEPPTATAC